MILPRGLILVLMMSWMKVPLFLKITVIYSMESNERKEETVEVLIKRAEDIGLKLESIINNRKKMLILYYINIQAL